MHIQHDVITFKFIAFYFKLKVNNQTDQLKLGVLLAQKSMSILREKIILMIYCELFSLTVPTS